MKRISKFTATDFTTMKKKKAKAAFHLNDDMYGFVHAYIVNNHLSGNTTIYVDEDPQGNIIVSTGTGQSKEATNQKTASSSTQHPSGDYVQASMKQGVAPEVQGRSTDPRLSNIYCAVGIASSVIYLAWQITSLVFMIKDRKAGHGPQNPKGGEGDNNVA
jgi:hypothetical protein